MVLLRHAYDCKIVHSALQSQQLIIREVIKTFQLTYLFAGRTLGILNLNSVPGIRNLPSPFILPCIREQHLLQSNGSRSLALWERCEAEVWLHDLHLGEQLLGLWALDAGVHNHIVTWNPVDWGGDAVLVASLKRVNNAENLGGVAAGRCWVREDETNGLLGVDHEDCANSLANDFFITRAPRMLTGADGESNALLVNVGSVLLVDPGFRC